MQRQTGALPVRVITWNVRQGGGRRIPQQIAALAERQPDIVALQEVIPRTAATYAGALHAIGLLHCRVSFEASPGDGLYTGRRHYGTLIASRWPLHPLAYPAIAMPWPERLLSVSVNAPVGDVHVHSAYVPVWSNKEPLAKIETMEGIFARITARPARPQILCADLNSPRRELEDGTLITFAQQLGSNQRYYVAKSFGLGPRRDQAERQLLTGMSPHGIVDVFRTVHGYTERECSWWHRGLYGYRLDHILASQSLNPVSCSYLHPLREQRLSDHSPLEALFLWSGNQPPASLPHSSA